MNQPDRLWQGALLVALALLQWPAKAEEVRVGTREELAEALRNAKAGSTILIASGTYRGGLARTNLHGTKEQPIVIAGADPARPPVIEGGGSGLHLSSPEHVELRDLVFAKASGNGLNIDDSGSTSTPAHDLVLMNIAVRDAGPTGNRDGIKLSGITNFRIEECRIERWGSSGSAIDMVGCRKGVVQGPRRWPIRILQENTDPRFVACRNGRFIKNVIAFRSDEVREVVNIGPKTSPESFAFSGNVWHCLDHPAETQRLVRLPAQESAGIYGRVPGFKDPQSGDIRIPDNKPQDAGVRPDAP